MRVPVVFNNGARRYPHQRAEGVALAVFIAAGLVGPIAAAVRMLVWG